MKAKALVVLVLAGVWGLVSWWWYACNIKGFCGTPVAHAEQATDTHSPEASIKTSDATADTHKADDVPATSDPLAVATAAEIKSEAAPVPAASSTTSETSAENKLAANPVETKENNPAPIEAKPAETTETAKQLESEVKPTETAATPSAAEETKPAETTKPTEASKAETPPIDPAPSTEPITTHADDSDKDGIPNDLEKKLGLDPYMADSDKDGVSDKDELGEKPAEAPLDTDDDGTINALDTDDDGDGDLTSNEVVDPNKDGSVADARDSDHDGIPDYLDKDSGWATLDDDNDGISNGEEKEAGTNPSLTDSDGDGVPDSIELADKKDTDEDGILDALDTDDDNDGVMTAMENPDPNSDGKLTDAADHNKNGVPDYLDAKSSGETVAQNNSTAEPSPKDPDMATGKPVAKPTEATTSEPTEAAKPANTEQTESTDTPTALEKSENKPEKASSKTKDADKITVDLDKPNADKKNIGSARLYFPFRSSKPELADSTAEYFDDLISFLKANPKATVKVIGHTDNVGDADINEKLGLQRAERIRTQLIKRGAPADRVEASSKGETTPWVTNKTEEGRNKNRRVEVKPIK